MMETVRMLQGQGPWEGTAWQHAWLRRLRLILLLFPLSLVHTHSYTHMTSLAVIDLSSTLIQSTLPTFVSLCIALRLPRMIRQLAGSCSASTASVFSQFQTMSCSPGEFVTAVGQDAQPDPPGLHQHQRYLRHAQPRYVQAHHPQVLHRHQLFPVWWVGCGLVYPKLHVGVSSNDLSARRGPIFIVSHNQQTGGLSQMAMGPARHVK